MLERYGLRIVCLACGWEGRHFQARGRLRAKACDRCGASRALRPQWWVRRYPTAAGAQARDLRAYAQAVDGR
jgi:hypothetical protein